MFNTYGMSAVDIEAPKSFTPEELQSIRDIVGVLRVEGVNTTIRVSFGSTFNFDNVTAAVLAGVIKLLNIPFEDADVTLSQSSQDKEENNERLASIITMVESTLPPQPKPTGRNPLYEYAVTFDDIKPGVRVICYDMTNGKASYATITTKPFVLPDYPDVYWMFTKCDNQGIGVAAWSLADCGIIPNRHGVWRRSVFTVIDSREDRAKFNEWLHRRYEEASPDDRAAAILTSVN